MTPGPTCTPGQACVDAVPSGWSGFVLRVLQAGDAGGGCAAPYDTAQTQLGGQTNPDGGPATCAACSCAVPDSGITCSVNVEGDNTGCFVISPPPETPVPGNGVCTTIMGSGANGKVSAPSVTGGTCVPVPGAVTTPPPPPTSTTLVACAPPDAGAGAGGDAGSMAPCASGQACAALPQGVDGGMPSGVCVYQAGVQTCPPSGTTVFTDTYVVGALEDDRGCDCTCASPQCPGDGYLAGFTTSNCSGVPTYTFDAGSACNSNITNANRPTHAIYHPSRGGSPGTCAVASSGPSGSVTIDGGTATTFCCVP